MSGLIHVAGHERVSRFDLVRRAASAAGLDPSLVRANRQSDVVLVEPRPADISLDTSRLAALFPDLRRPTIEEAMGAFGPLAPETPARFPLYSPRMGVGSFSRRRDPRDG